MDQSRGTLHIPDTPVSRRRLDAEREASRPRCVWPNCGAPVGDVPLCTAHLAVASELHFKHRTGEPYVFRVREEIDVTPEPTPTAAPVEGVVYYLRSGGYLKIGWTADLAKRMRAYPPDSILLATEPGTRHDETRRHRMFAAHRTHGREWYAITPTLTHHIGQVVREHGQPDPVLFAAQPVDIPQPRQAQPVKTRATVRHVS